MPEILHFAVSLHMTRMCHFLSVIDRESGAGNNRNKLLVLSPTSRSPFHCTTSPL